MMSRNEFRGQLSDQTASFLTRIEYDGKHHALEKQVDDLGERVTRAEGAGSGRSAMFGWIIAAVGILVSIMAVIIATR